MIVQVRGAMGSGKSTAVRQLLQAHDAEPVEGHKNPWGITGMLWRCAGELYVFGSYKLTGVSPGGGGDKVSGPTGAALMLHYAKQVPHLLWESAWGSGEIPRTTWGAEMYPRGYMWAVLDTPPEECVRRIYQRRVERKRNVGAPLNEAKVRQSHAQLEKLTTRARTANLFPVVTLNHEHAAEQLHDLLVSGGWRCDQHPVRWQWPTMTRAAS